MKILKTALAAVAMTLSLAAAALAADIDVAVNAADKTLTFTSSVAVPVHVMALGSADGYYATSVELPAQGSATAPLVGDLPAGITSARCLAGPESIPGMTPAPEGFYLLSASVH